MDAGSGIGTYVRKQVREAVKDIISLSSRYRAWGKDFSFSSFPELEKEVNSELISLSDSILNDIRRRIRLALEEMEQEDAYDEVITSVEKEHQGMMPIERIDRYSTHLRHNIEGWLAVGFVNAMTDHQIATAVMSNLYHPEFSEKWIDAIRDGSFAPSILQEGGYSYGRGIQQNPADGLTLIEQTMLKEGMAIGTIMKFRKDGAIGYKVVRGSSYDCEVCDELTLHVWPLSEVVIPSHPRCRCRMVPVYGK